MERDLTVGKLKLNVEEFHINLRTALEYAYAAGYDAGTRRITANFKKRIGLYHKQNGKVGEYESGAEASRRTKTPLSSIRNAINRGSVSRSGHYWKYEDNEKGDH